MRTREEVVHAFNPVGKLSEAQQMRLLKVQKAFEDLATDIVDLAPDCPDRTSGLRKLLDSKFTVVQAITHHYGDIQPAKKEEENAQGKTGKKTRSKKS